MKLFSINKNFAILTAFLLLDCALGGYIGFWREPFWASVGQKHLGLFIYYLSLFSIVALISCYINGKSTYLAGIIALEIRTKLTKKAFLLNNHGDIEGGSQRIQEDCFSYPTLMISLVGGLLRSIIMLIVFAIILLYRVEWYYLLIPVVYAIIGTLIAGKIAHPLIDLNYINQVAEAKFRQVLTKVNYLMVHRNNYNLFVTTKKLTYFQTFYNQITVIVPYIILSGLYFSSKITFGVFMQVASSMAEIINSMSYLINVFPDINRFLSCRRRLKEMRIL